MCRTCLTTPCHPRCPNAEPEKPIYSCYNCQGKIFFDEKYVEIDGVQYCVDCIDNMESRDILKLFDIRVQSAC